MTDPTFQSGNPPWRKPPFKVVVVLPAYNEEENLGELLERIDQVMTDAGQRYEVLVVDDGSKDRTFEIAEQHGRQMPVKVHKHVVNQGLGGTIRDCLTLGAQMCEDRDIVVSMDADNTHTPALIPSMVQMVLEGNDVVIASRYQPGSYIRGVPWHREMLSIGARWLFQIAFPVHGVRDYTCGFRAYRVPILKQAIAKYGDQFVSEAGFQCMVDILLKMRTMNAIFREAPMVLRYDLKGGVSKMNVARTVWRTLTLLLRRRFGG
ncbi:MAG TPA: glycosyltransferase family 2 protein [Tepidisphaeraceae bacterium]|nr:glycosyltransferase family 2 protein [Tepidisphaeraceae bacterium]